MKNGKMKRPETVITSGLAGAIPVTVTREDLGSLRLVRRRVDKLWADLKIALDPQRPIRGVNDRRQHLADALDAFFIFMRDLGFTDVAAKEIDELRQALIDANAGRQHPLFIPSKRTSKSAQEHSDYGQLWRARANVVLAIRADRALALLNGSETSFRASVERLVRQGKLPFIEEFASGRSLTKLNNAEKPQEHLYGLPETWEGELQRRKNGPANRYAAELYTVTCDLIRARKDDASMLCWIRDRCLRAAEYDGQAEIRECEKSRLATL